MSHSHAGCVGVFSKTMMSPAGRWRRFFFLFNVCFPFLQEMNQALLQQQKGTVNVEVESKESVDLLKVLEDVREQYESLVAKNQVEVEKWFQTKVRNDIITHKILFEKI